MLQLSFYVWVLFLCSCQWAWEQQREPVDLKYVAWYCKETARLTYRHYRYHEND